MQKKTKASIPTVIDTIRKYCEEGLAAAIAPARNPNSDTARLKATGDVEAKVIAKACMANFVCSYQGSCCS